jgi:hypothetical protein
MSNVFEKIAEWTATEGEVILSDVESVLSGISGKVATILGVAMAVDMTVVEGVSPPLAAAIAAGITGLQNLHTDVSAAVTAVGNTGPMIAQQLAGLSAAADALHTQAAPFIAAISVDAGAVDKAVVASAALATGLAA